jgi:uncharacterized protein YbgA (DUF1722 family)
VRHDNGVLAGARRVRLIGVSSGTDWTAPMTAFSSKRVRGLSSLGLSGYVLKKDSPSCGLERVRVHGGAPDRAGRGLFAEALVTAMPNLPVEEEGRLDDPVVRENFVERVFAYQRLRALFTGRWSPGALVAFHTAHKLQLLSHSRPRYGELGRLVARADTVPRRELAAEYEALFMSALARPATGGRQADVMTHVVGHLKRRIDQADRDELLAAIDDHRRGVVPLVVPLTLIQHHVRRHDVAYLRDQTYLDPHPRELALRNHV